MDSFTGTGALIRLILRRDRVALPLWIGLIGLSAVGYARGFAGLYPTPELRRAFADAVASNPAELALLGPVFATTLGGLTAWRWSTPGAILVGLASLITVVRHTRAEEQAGRRELLGAAAVGRHAPLAAALAVACCAGLLVAALAALGMVALGLPPAGALALALGVAGVGWVCAAAAAVAAQLSGSAGGAGGLAGAALGVAYLLRAAGEGGGADGRLGWLAWLSPLGWTHALRPFAGERWELLLLFPAATAALAMLAFLLVGRRDLGAGLLPARPGPAEAPELRSPLALAWRLHRGALLGWAAGLGLVGLVFGVVADSVTAQLAANPQALRLFEQLGRGAGPGDGFLTLTLMLLGEVAAVYAISAALRPREEERGGHAELVLAAPVGRVRWAADHLAIATLGAGAVLAAFGLGAGLSYGLSAGQVGRDLPRILAAALAYLPALAVLIGVAAALHGLLPRAAVYGSWGVLVLCLLIDMGNELQQVDQLVLGLTPFTHVPRLLAGESSPASLIGLCLMATALMAAGLAGLRRRDLA